MGRLSFAASLPKRAAVDWQAAIDHPFVEAVARGDLQRDQFHVWLRQDFLFVEELCRFIVALVGQAPDSDRGGLESGLAALGPELDLFHAYAAREGVDLLAVPLKACADYLAFLKGCAARGYGPGLAAYYGCERAYLEAWTRVRDEAAPGNPYRDWIVNWSSEPFRAYVGWLGERLDAIAIGLRAGALDELTDVFRRTVAHEVAFWDACGQSQGE